jgi:hypothetical protein
MDSKCYGVYLSDNPRSHLVVGPFDSGHPFDLSRVYGQKVWRFSHKYNYSTASQEAYLQDVFSTMQASVISPEQFYS